MEGLAGDLQILGVELAKAGVSSTIWLRSRPACSAASLSRALIWATLEAITPAGYLHAELAADGAVRALRGRGLWAGVDIDPVFGTGRGLAERLMARGVLVKKTHGSTLRIAPPLVIEKDDLAWGLGQPRAVLAEGVALKWTALARTGGQARRSSWRRRLILVDNPSTRSFIVLSPQPPR